MGQGELPIRSARLRVRELDRLDLLTQRARQLREDRRWRRRQRRRRIAAAATVAVIGAASLGYVLSVRNADADPTTTPDISATIASPDPSGSSSAPASPTPSTASTSRAARRKAVAMYGRPRSGLLWHSGFWTGGQITGAHVNAAGSWRGTPMDFATVYPSYGTWAEIEQSSWTVTSFAGYKGRLSYGLPLLPKNRKGKWQDILSGSHDQVFRSIARLLVRNGHEDAAIRMGVEANGYWFPWAVTVETTDEFKAAFRRIRSIMAAESPEFTFWLDLNCGTVLTGSSDRLAPLLEMYPGDDVVDGISMDHYNRYKLLASDEASWRRAISPSWAPGLRDGVSFARVHNKGFAVPEWGLDGVQGPGDSPFFMKQMFQFFTDSADVLVYENYFNEPDPYIKGGLFDSTLNPDSAKIYRKLWGRKN
jgi:hypothetical protein